MRILLFSFLFFPILKLRIVVHGILQLDWRLSDDPIDEDTNDDYKDAEYRKGVKCKIFLGCTSNLISSGVRETIRFLIEHKLVGEVVIFFLPLFPCSKPIETTKVYFQL